MALALLTVHLAGLLVFAWTCFASVTDEGIAGHIWLGLAAVMLVVFAHTMSYLYLVAMTSVIRKALAGESGPPVLVDDPRGPELLKRSKRLKAGVAWWAMGGMVLPMVAFILGGGAHTRAFPPLVHSGAAYAVLAFMAGAAVVIGLALLRQNRIVEAFQLAAQPPIPPES